MVAGFYDVDNTVININSMLSFFEFFSMKYGTANFYVKRDNILSCISDGGYKRKELNKLYYRCFEGYKLQDIFEFGKSWFKEYVSGQSVFNRSVVDTIFKHQQEGHKIVFVSGSMHPLLDPIAELFNIDAVLCTSLCINHKGIITGELSDIPVIGVGKRVAIEKYAAFNNIDLSKSFSYGDDVSDIPMLECVGQSVCVGQQNALIQHASLHNWAIIST